MPRGAGPAFFSPLRLYCEPWHWHSNHWLVLHSGIRQPRCGHFWLKMVRPASMATSNDGAYDRLGERQRLGRILGDPRSRLGNVEEPVALLDARLEVVDLAHRDEATEATGSARPEEGDERRGGERAEADTHERHRGPVEELAARDTDHLGVRRRPLDDLHLCAYFHLGAARRQPGRFDLGRRRCVDDRFGLLARRAVALHGLAGQRAGTADVAATRHREEGDGAENDDDTDGDGYDCCSTHDWGVSFRSLTVRRTGLRPRGGRS